MLKIEEWYKSQNKYMRAAIHTAAIVIFLLSFIAFVGILVSGGPFTIPLLIAMVIVGIYCIVLE